MAYFNEFLRHFRHIAGMECVRLAIEFIVILMFLSDHRTYACARRCARPVFFSALCAGYHELLIFCSDDELAGRARPRSHPCAASRSGVDWLGGRAGVTGRKERINTK
jgi:hypothetical protein